jgi:hypothetical protein
MVEQGSLVLGVYELFDEQPTVRVELRRGDVNVE